MTLRRIVGAFMVGITVFGVVACSPSADDRQTAREGYCISAKLDFGRFIRMASDPSAKPRDQGSARSILGIFASNGDEWMQESPRRLRADSRAILEASRSAARGVHIAADDIALVGPLLRVRRYSQQCD